jgi:hypothetical protein
MDSSGAMSSQQIADEIEINGFAIVKDCLPKTMVNRLVEQLSQAESQASARTPLGQDLCCAQFAHSGPSD